MARNTLTIAITGAAALDTRLRQLASETGAKGINAEMRKATHEAVKEIVLPAVLDLIPVDTGELEDAIKIRAIKRSRGKVGYYVGFADPLFQGDSYYGGFIEFGFTHFGNVEVEADSYLRRALYPNAIIVLEQVRHRLAAFVAKANRFHA